MKPRSASISVVITTFNRPNKLLRLLKSIEDQRLLPAETIIINDGGEEDPAILQWVANHNGFRFLTVSNGGVSQARNTGIGEVQTHYTCLCDDDDFYLEHHISTLDSTIHSIQEPTLLHTHRKELTNSGITDPEVHPKPKEYTNQEHYVSKGEMVICCTCFPTAAFKEFPFPAGEKYAEDHEQRLMAMSTFPVQSIPDKTAVVDRTGESATSNILDIGPHYRRRFRAIFNHHSIRPHVRRSIRQRQIFRWSSLMMSEYRRELTPFNFFQILLTVTHVRSLANIKTWTLHVLWTLRP